MLTSISATPQANALLGRLEVQHGPLSLHFTGRVGGSLTCLPAGELRVSNFDVLIGHFRGVPLYMREDDAKTWTNIGMVISLTPGHTRGFSLEGGTGQRFVLTPMLFEDTEDAGQKDQPREI